MIASAQTNPVLLRPSQASCARSRKYMYVTRPALYDLYTYVFIHIVITTACILSTSTRQIISCTQ